MNNNRWLFNEEFKYFDKDLNEHLNVSWNMIDDEVRIIKVEGPNLDMDEETLYEFSEELADDIFEYIEVNYAHNEDFWFDKAHPEL